METISVQCASSSGIVPRICISSLAEVQVLTRRCDRDQQAHYQESRVPRSAIVSHDLKGFKSAGSFFIFFLKPHPNSQSSSGSLCCWLTAVRITIPLSFLVFSASQHLLIPLFTLSSIVPLYRIELGDHSYFSVMPASTQSFSSARLESLQDVKVPSHIVPEGCSAPQVDARAKLSHKKAFSTAPETSDSSHSCAHTVSELSYSPPPTPTRISSVSRFSTPLLAGGHEAATPSLLHLSLSSTVSSPFLAHTPMQYTTTRNPDVSNVGLGLSGIFSETGSAFDAMNLSFAKQDEMSDLGFFMDEKEGAGSWFGQDSFTHPEQEEGAWTKRISRQIEPGTFNILRDLDTGSPSLEPGLDSPTVPSVDDVFYNHAPVMSSTPRHNNREAREQKHRSGLSRAMVTSWSKNVQLAGQDEGMSSFY